MAFSEAIFRQPTQTLSGYMNRKHDFVWARPFLDRFSPLSRHSPAARIGA
jgi:hypothetical protein